MTLLHQCGASSKKGMVMKVEPALFLEVGHCSGVMLVMQNTESLQFPKRNTDGIALDTNSPKNDMPVESNVLFQLETVEQN